MKKLYFSLLASLFIINLSFGQAVIFNDNFDAYTAGTALTLQNPVDWTTWSGGSGTAEDPLVSNAFAFSGNNSLLITSAPRPRDCVHPIPNYTTGIYKISFRMYIPTGFDGYFNTLQLFAGAGSSWAMQVYFYAGGNGNMDAGGALIAPFTFQHNTWMLLETVANLTANQGQVYLNGNLLHTWTWSGGAFGTGTLNQLGGTNLYGHNDPSTVEPAEFYIDNFEVWDMVIPVELTSFTAISNNGLVQLNWTTATELNNQMFEIQRQVSNEEFVSIGFVNGRGTTTEPQEYSYVDRTVTVGTYTYRLKQIDYDGRVSYSPTVEVDVLPTDFVLEQNYPNPFNPSTNIRFGIPESGYARLAVYNIVGEEVAVLLDGNIDAGIHNVAFDAQNLPSGTYIYKLQSSNSIEVKKMVLMK
jgi:hypothetical protein